MRRLYYAFRIWWGGQPLVAISQWEAMRRAWQLAVRLEHAKHEET